MDVVIATTGFELDASSRDSIAKRARQLLEPSGIAQFELSVRQKYFYSRGSDDPIGGYAAYARVVIDEANTTACSVEDENFARAVDDALDEVTAFVKRRQALEESAVPCARCGDTQFALVGDWADMHGIDALVCKACGRAELLVREPRSLRRTLDVTARAKPPYR